MSTAIVTAAADTDVTNTFTTITDVAAATATAAAALTAPENRINNVIEIVLLSRNNLAEQELNHFWDKFSFSKMTTIRCYHISLEKLKKKKRKENNVFMNCLEAFNDRTMESDITLNEVGLKQQFCFVVI